MAIEKHLLGRIIHKHDIEENWDKATGFIPQQGEIIVYDIDDNYEYERFKIGDGKTTVINLPFQKTNINDLKAVSYDIAQELTDEQKIQARANIGAGTPDSIKIIEATYYANGESTISSTEEEINTLIAEGKNVCIDCFIEPEDRTFRFYFSTKTSSGTTLFVNTEISDGAPELKLLTLIGSTFMIITMPVPLRSLATESKDGLMSTEDKVKLESIEEGAQVNVQSDWNQNDETASDFVKNKPFGNEIVEILPETTIEVTSTELPIATEIELLEGSTYTVHWNGTEYTCIAQKWEIDGATAGIVVGDLSVVTTGESTTGEPFLIADISSEFAAEVGGIPTFLAVFDESTSVTVSIKGEVVKKIDNKYLEPFEIVNNTEIIEIFPETELTFEWSVDGSYNELSSVLSLIPDNTYTIICDGVEYNSVCHTATTENLNITWIGNLVDVVGGNIAEITGATSTEEPFVIINNSFENAPTTTQISFIPDSSNTENENHTFAIYLNKNKDVARIKTECLPEPLQFNETIVEILPETVIEQSEFPATVPLIVGNTYTVKFNGVEYDCVCRAYGADGILGYILGNFDAMTGEGDTGEPFVLASIPSLGGCMIEVLDESITSVTLSITGAVITKLDNKYLDIEWIPSSKPATRVEVFPETTVNATGDTIPLTEEFIASAENKVPYIVTWNGTEYTCTGLSIGSWFAIGNLYLFNLGSFPNTGEPFLFFTTGQNLIISYTDEGSATFKIDRGYYDTLPYKFAPASYTIAADLYANSEQNNGDELVQAEYVLKHGGKVFGTVDGEPVEILNLIADTMDHFHKITWRVLSNGIEKYGNIYTQISDSGFKAQTPAVDRKDILLRYSNDSAGGNVPPQKFKFTVDQNGNLISSNEDGTNQKKYLTSIPEEYVTEDELTAKGYLTSIPEEYVTETELNNILDSKGYLTQHQSLADYAKTSEVDTKIANLVNSAPEKLNTLDELAAALGDDENFANTVTTELGKKINSSDLASWAKSSTKPTYTASEIGAAEVEHTHDEYAIKDSPTFTGEFTHGTRGVNSVVGDNSFVSGYDAIASGSRSHAEGTGTIAYGQNSHAEGAGAQNSITITIKANSTNVSYTGTNPIVNSLIEYNANIRKVISVDINNKTFVIDSAFSDVDDYDNVIAYLYIYGALGNTSHVEGYYTAAFGEHSHAEGASTIASGDESHAEGASAEALG